MIIEALRVLRHMIKSLECLREVAGRTIAVNSDSGAGSERGEGAAEKACIVLENTSIAMNTILLETGMLKVLPVRSQK